MPKDRQLFVVPREDTQLIGEQKTFRAEIAPHCKNPVRIGQPWRGKA
jgi:hypothetical protein